MKNENVRQIPFLTMFFRVCADDLVLPGNEFIGLIKDSKKMSGEENPEKR